METRKRKNQELVVIIENDIIVPHIKKEPIDFEESKHQPNMYTVDVNKQHIALIENNIDVANVKLEPNDITIDINTETNPQNLITNDMIIANIKEEVDIEPIEVTLENVYDNHIDIDEDSVTVNIKEEPSEVNAESAENNQNYIIPNATVNIKQEKKEVISNKKTELACNIVQTDENFVTVKIEPDSINNVSLEATVKEEEEEEEQNLNQYITDFSPENVVVRVETLILIDCPHCPKKFLTEEFFQAHYKQEHICLKCKKTLKIPYSPMSLIPYSTNIDFKICYYCHISMLKKGPVKKICKLCGFESTASFMTEHFEIVHKMFDKKKCELLCELVDEPVNSFEFY